MERSRFAELLPECVEVVPQRNDLGRSAGAEQRDRTVRQDAAGGSRHTVQVALVFADMCILEHAETDTAVARPKSSPSHATAPAGAGFAPEAWSTRTPSP